MLSFIARNGVWVNGAWGPLLPRLVSTFMATAGTQPCPHTGLAVKPAPGCLREVTRTRGQGPGWLLHELAGLGQREAGGPSIALDPYPS